MISPTDSPVLSSRERRKRIALLLLRALVSLALLLLLFSQITWDEFSQALESFDPAYLVLIAALFYLSIGLSTYKWQTILAYLGIRGRYRTLYSTYLIGLYFGNFLPTSVGGDTYRFIKLRADNPGASDRILSSMLLERGYGYLMLLVVNIALLALYWQTLAASQLLFWIEVLIALSVIGLVLAALFGRGVLERLVNRWPVMNPLKRLMDLLAIRDSRTVAVSSGTSLLFVLIVGVSLGLYYRADGAQISWIFALFVSTFTGIIGIVPLTINGLGLTELIQVVLLGFIGIPIETVLAVSVLQRVMRLLLSLPGAALYFGGSARNAQKPERRQE